MLIVPELEGTEGRHSGLFKFYLPDRVFGHLVTDRITTLDGQVGKIDVKLQLSQVIEGAQVYRNYFRFAVGIGREVQHFAGGCSFGQVILLITGDGRYCKPLHHRAVLFPVAVDQVVHRAPVVFFPNARIDNVLTDKRLGLDTLDQHFSVAPEDDDIVDIGALADVFSFIALEAGSYKTFCLVDVKFCIGNGNLGRFHHVELFDFRLSLPDLSVFAF